MTQNQRKLDAAKEELEGLLVLILNFTESSDEWNRYYESIKAKRIEIKRLEAIS